MRFGWALLASLICLIIWLLRNATGEMLKEEMQTRLCRIPNAVIRVSVLRLPEQSRSELADEWLSELAFIVNKTEGCPSPDSRVCSASHWAAPGARSRGRPGRAASSPSRRQPHRNASRAPRLPG